MAEGYISYDSFNYSNAYINHTANTPSVVIWDNERDEEKREGELLQTNGKTCMIKSKSLIIFQISTQKLFTLKFILMHILISYVLYMLV